MNLWVLEFDAGIDDEDSTFTGMPLAVCTSADQAKLIAEEIHGKPLHWTTDDDEDNPGETGVWWVSKTNDSLVEGAFENTYLNISGWRIRPCKLNEILRISWNVKWNEAHQEGSWGLWKRQRTETEPGEGL